MIFVLFQTRHAVDPFPLSRSSSSPPPSFLLLLPTPHPPLSYSYSSPYLLPPSGFPVAVTALKKTCSDTTAAVGMDGSSGRMLEASGVDLCFVAQDTTCGSDGGGGSSGAGGEIARALDMLPQRMADLEELATSHGLQDEVHY